MTQLVKATRYYLLSTDDYHNHTTIPLFDPQGNTLAMVSPDACVLGACEGSVKLPNGNVLNITSHYVDLPQQYQSTLLLTAKGQFRSHYTVGGINAAGDKVLAWEPCSASWGWGMHAKPLIPFVSVASDQTLYPFGTRLYSSTIAGQTMPDGSLHDGYLSCDDRGSHVIGQHLDLFTGTNEWAKRLTIPDTIAIVIA